MNQESGIRNQESKEKIAAVIPAYNEESRIGKVLLVVKNVVVIDEVIVVNDGSTDKTAEVVKKYDVKLISSPKNVGKGAALKKGMDSTDADILVFIDADLVGLTEQHVKDMINPLFDDGSLAMTVGKFKGGRKRTDWAQKIASSISGQRAFRRWFAEGMPDFSDTGYGVEIIFTQHAKKIGAKVKEVIIDDATHVMKEEKLGLFKGVISRLGMYFDLLKHLFTKKKMKEKS